VIDAANQEVIRLNPETLRPTGHVQDTDEFAQLTAIAVAPGYIWVTDSANNKLLRIPNEPHLSDAGTEIRSVSVGRYPRTVAVDPDSGNVWVGNANDRSLTVVDGGTAELLHTYSVSLLPHFVAVDDGEVWVSGYINP